MVVAIIFIRSIVKPVPKDRLHLTEITVSHTLLLVAVVAEILLLAAVD
jgi:hypothetical protein